MPRLVGDFAEPPERTSGSFGGCVDQLGHRDRQTYTRLRRAEHGYPGDLKGSLVLEQYFGDYITVGVFIATGALLVLAGLATAGAATSVGAGASP